MKKKNGTEVRLVSHKEAKYVKKMFNICYCYVISVDHNFSEKRYH